MLTFTAMDASASGLTAQRLRLDLIANNLANINTTRTPEGGPYRREVAVFAPRQAGGFGAMLAARLGGVPGRFAGGVTESPGTGVMVQQIVSDPSPFKRRYDPQNPDAGPDGYVLMPNVDLVTEMVDLLSATRSYEANVTVLNAAKAMAQKALELGRI